MQSVMNISLTRVGNSRAIIIPAKILKQIKITDNSALEMTIDEMTHTISIRKTGVKENPVFPKVKLPEISDEQMQQFMDSLYHIPQEEIDADERLKYILSK